METSCGFITKVIPSSRCSYLSIGVYHDCQHTFPHLIVPCTWHNCNKRPTPCHIRWVSGQSHKWCRIDFVAFGHATQLGELRFPRCHAPTGSDLCINSHWNVVILLACCCFQIFCQNLVIIVWGTWYVCQTFAAVGSRAVWVARMCQPNLVVNWKKGMGLLPCPA